MKWPKSVLWSSMCWFDDLRVGSNVSWFVVILALGFDPFVEIEFAISYAKCVNRRNAHKLFDEMPINDVTHCFDLV